MFITFWILRIAFLIVITRAFVLLSKHYRKNVITYSVGAVIIFAFGFAIGLGIMSLLLNRFPDNGFVLSLSKWSGLTFGAVSTIIFYYALKNRWQK